MYYFIRGFQNTLQDKLTTYILKCLFVITQSEPNKDSWLKTESWISLEVFTCQSLSFDSLWLNNSWGPSESWKINVISGGEIGKVKLQYFFIIALLQNIVSVTWKQGLKRKLRSKKRKVLVVIIKLICWYK